jgi:hypothetical protein
LNHEETAKEPAKHSEDANQQISHPSDEHVAENQHQPEEQHQDSHQAEKRVEDKTPNQLVDLLIEGKNAEVEDYLDTLEVEKRIRFVDQMNLQLQQHLDPE